MSITGRFRVEPRAEALPDLTEVSIHAEWLPGASTISLSGSSKVASDGTFVVRNAGAGPARLAFSRLPDGWAVKSIMYGGRDVTDTLNLRDDLSGVEVVLTNRVSEISGVVTDADNRALDDYTVVVFASDAARWDNPRYLATARPDQAGRFSVRGLPAGSYLAVAVHEVQPGEASDPEYLEEVRSSATRVTLGDGETKSLDLKIKSELPPS